MKNLKLLAALALASSAFAVSAQNIATVNGQPIPKSHLLWTTLNSVFFRKLS